jgi:hypothetical protein
MIIADVGIAMRTVDRKIHRHAIPIGKALGELTRQRKPLLGRQLMRQGNLDFTGDTGILAFLGSLGGIPQGRTVPCPCGIRPFRQDDLGVLYPGAPPEIMHQAVAQVFQLFGRPIGRGGDGAAPRSPRHRFHAQVIDRHRAILIPDTELRRNSCAGTFLSNAAVLQVFGVNDHDSARLVSDLLGQETVVFHTMSRALDSETSGLSLAEHHTGRPLLTPDEIRNLPQSRELLFLAGRRPILADKLRYYADREFAGMFDAA